MERGRTDFAAHGVVACAARTSAGGGIQRLGADDVACGRVGGLPAGAAPRGRALRVACRGRRPGRRGELGGRSRRTARPARGGRTRDDGRGGRTEFRVAAGSEEVGRVVRGRPAGGRAGDRRAGGGTRDGDVFAAV